jgi:hypothetical protein
MTCVKKYLILLLLPVFFVANTSAQANRFSGWALSANTIKVTSKWSIIFDTQLRSTDDWRQPETFIFRPGLAYNSSGGHQLSMGFAWIENWRTLAGVRDGVSDNRIWQQWIKTQTLKQATLQHRVRLEERMIPTLTVAGTELKKTNTQFNARLRYFNRYINPFGPKNKLVRGPYWALQNEIFLNVAGLRYSHGKFFDQSRSYAGIGLRLNPAADLELGWMTQYALGRNGNHFVNNIVQVSSFLRL